MGLRRAWTECALVPTLVDEGDTAYTGVGKSPLQCLASSRTLSASKTPSFVFLKRLVGGVMTVDSGPESTVCNWPLLLMLLSLVGAPQAGRNPICSIPPRLPTQPGLRLTKMFASW